MLFTTLLTLQFLSGCAWGNSPVKSGATPTAGLQSLAARADHKNTWPALRKYAGATKDPEQRGRAYFVLGYREYEANDYGPAAADLDHAGATRFTLADFAVYYQARAAFAGGQPEKADAALEDFATRFPQSTLRDEATALLAQALLQAGQPERAITLLKSQPQKLPTLIFYLGRAYQQTQHLAEAANTFQEVYYNFPLAPESALAAEQLKQLKAQLGASFPTPDPGTAAHRAALLYERGRFDDALREYRQLAEQQPEAAMADEWRIGEARCLVRLKRPSEAIEAAKGLTSANPQIAAQALQVLVDANAQMGDADAMLQALDQLGKAHTQSPAYASALNAAGSFVVRRGDWESAARYYATVVTYFPTSAEAREASWRVAWSCYLRGQSENARQALTDHLARYPDSPHEAAGLYWLGRLAEEGGRTAEAQVYFKLLQNRFVHTYYALRASDRMVKLPSVPVSGETSLAAGISLPDAVPAAVCEHGAQGAALHPFVVLKQLSLAGLARRYLNDLLSDDSTQPQALLALSRLESEEKAYDAALFAARRLVPDYPRYELSQLPKEIWELLYPRAFWNLVAQQARANRLDPYLVLGLIRQESAFNPRATSAANARGLMQVLPSTAGGRSKRSRRAAEKQLYSPAYNVRFGCRYLATLLREFGGNVEEAVAAYNAGGSRVKEWLRGRSFNEPAEFVESIPFRDTRAYVEAVLRDAGTYKGMLASPANFKKCN